MVCSVFHAYEMLIHVHMWALVLLMVVFPMNCHPHEVAQANVM